MTITEEGSSPSRALRTLARNLEQLRLNHPTLNTQTAIANQAGIDQRTVGRVLACEHEPGVGVVERLAEAFGLDTWQLLHPVTPVARLVHEPCTTGARCVTNSFLNDARTPGGGWTRAQLALLGVEWPPLKGWKARVIGDSISADIARQFEELGRAGSNPKKTPVSHREDKTP